jgi:hypothetical protein
LKLMENYYELRKLKAHIASSDSLLGKNWKIFLKIEIIIYKLKRDGPI